MKRLIKASGSVRYDQTTIINHGPQRFHVKFTTHNDIIDAVQITEIHPYDDAEYAWARMIGPQVTFIRDGKILDKMTMAEYDDEYYDTFDEYLDDTFDAIAVELRHFNKDVKPVMVHN